MAQPRARELWIRRLAAIATDTVNAIVDEVPQLLRLNQRRMIDGDRDR
jgi:hypothetical protein